MDWYNGFSPAERTAKLAALKAAMKSGIVPPPSGPCSICGDVTVDVEYHDEDYGQEYVWAPPAMYVLCRHCHRSKLHGRFNHPNVWEAFKVHVRRGGYAREWSSPMRKREAMRALESKRADPTYEPTPIRPYHGTVGAEWWSQLTTDRASLRAPWARPARQPLAESMKPEPILVVGAEGGGVTLLGWRHGQAWRFCREVIDQTPWMLGEQAIEHTSEVVGTFDAAVGLLDRYQWQRLYPVKVHPEFRAAVWSALQKRDVSLLDDRELGRWRQRCGITDKY